MNVKTKKILNGILNGFLWAFLIFALLMTIMAFSAQANSAGFPKLGDKCFLTVRSDSMDVKGGFGKGDMIIGRVLTDQEKKQLQEGDIVTFYADLTPDDGQDNKDLNTHRIVEICEDKHGGLYYATKGDNVGTRDPYPVYPEDVQAIWTGKRISVVGSIVNFVQGKVGFLVCIVLPMLLFFVYAVYVLISTVNTIKNSGKKQITAEDEELIKQRAVEEYIRSMQAAQQTTPPETTAETTENNAE